MFQLIAEVRARTTAYPENTLDAGDIFLGGLVFVLAGAGTVFTIRALSTGGAAQ